MNELHRKLELLLQRQSNPYDVAAGLIDDFRASTKKIQEAMNLMTPHQKEKHGR
jgi:hypothetical protein